MIVVPLIGLLGTVSTNGIYIGLTLVIWIFSTSNLVLIMLQKVLAFYEIYGGKTARRGARGGTRVTGLDTPPTGNVISAGGEPRLKAILETNPSSNHSTVEAPVNDAEPVNSSPASLVPPTLTRDCTDEL